MKNQSLEVGLDVAKSIVDFYIKYCNWFASTVRSQPESILDIGCDNGILTCFYAYLFPKTEVIGIDRSEAGIHCAVELAKRLNLSNVKFKKVDFNNVEEFFGNKCFDIVTSVRSIHEIMGTIPVPIYWSLEDYLGNNQIMSDYKYIEIINNVLREDGEYISAERIENPAAVGQWANLLAVANLHLKWECSDFIEFHEMGKDKKMPVIVATKSDTGIKTIEGIQELYTRNVNMDIAINRSFWSVAAEIVFNEFTSKDLRIGCLLKFNNHWYKMKYEIWSSDNHLLVYGCGNMGYRQLELFPLASIAEAELKMKELLNIYINHGQTFKYSKC